MKIRFTIFNQADLKVMSAEEFDGNDEVVYGYFEISFGGHAEGEYFDFDIPEELVGGEALNYWFESLLEVLHLFQNEKTNYVAIRVIEYVDRWIEMKKISDRICLNVVQAENRGKLLRTSQLGDPHYEHPLNTMENYDSFYQEIIRATTELFEEIRRLNPNLMKTRAVVRISNYLHDLENK